MFDLPDLGKDLEEHAQRIDALQQELRDVYTSFQASSLFAAMPGADPRALVEQTQAKMREVGRKLVEELENFQLVLRQRSREADQRLIHLARAQQLAQQRLREEGHPDFQEDGDGERGVPQ